MKILILDPKADDVHLIACSTATQLNRAEFEDALARCGEYDVDIAGGVNLGDIVTTSGELALKVHVILVVVLRLQQVLEFQVFFCKIR